MTQKVKSAKRKRRQAEAAREAARAGTGTWRIFDPDGFVFYDQCPARGGQPIKFVSREAAEAYLQSGNWHTEPGYRVGRIL